MSETLEHMETALDFLDPEKGIPDLDRVKRELEDAINHYRIEQESKIVE